MSEETKRPASARTSAEPLSAGEAAEFEELLDYLKIDRGFDFSGYKRASLVRRVSARMAAVGVETFAQYLDFLQVDPHEFTELFNTILINVTGFFRDPPSWDYVAEHALPRILDAKEPGDPIRVWSAGCASGEEPFTAAMLLAEHLGADAVRERVKIYATDIDDAALDVARLATYSAREVAGVPEPLLERYFEDTAGRYTFRKDLRRVVIFGRHDLVESAPISHIDLLLCRNTIMYLDAETQGKVLSRFHFALDDHGVLFLGKAEMLLSHGHLFVPLDLKRRVFSKVTKDSARNRLTVVADSGSYDAIDYPVSYRRLREIAADAIPNAVLVVHASGTVAMANTAARKLFGLTAGDIGRPFQDLDVSFRPAELRSAVETVLSERRTVVLTGVEWEAAPGDVDCFDVHMAPVADRGAAPLGAAITFVDVSTPHRLQDELERSNRALETAYEELRSTNEELETTNEELQSTIEELETTNEELHSSNEELETMNAELNSTNEELQTINDELRLRSSEVEELNDFLESILANQRGGMAVIDRDMRVTVWNQRASEMWGVRSDEAPGQHFLNLDIGLAVEELRPAIRVILTGDSDHEEVELPATNRRGRDFTCRVSLGPLTGAKGTVRGAIVLMDEGEK